MPRLLIKNTNVPFSCVAAIHNTGLGCQLSALKCEAMVRCASEISEWR